MANGLIVIDPSVNGYEAWLGQASLDGAVILVLGHGSNPLQQIANYLSGTPDTFRAIHIVSHGANGALVLGDLVLTQENIKEHSALLHQIGQGLVAGGDILLYGCNIAADLHGQAFIQSLSSVIGMDVTASTNSSGPLNAGGDSVLEARTGPTEADSLDLQFLASKLAANTAPRFSQGDGIVTTAIGSFSDIANSVALQADGKIVAAGSAQSFSGTAFALARYNADGSLDTSFGSGGKVTSPVASGQSVARSVSVQDDGKIVVAGYADVNGKTGFSLERYQVDGSLDTSFGSAGKVTTAMGSRGGYANSAILQADGKIVVAGYTQSYGYLYDFALARYNTDGSLDDSFGVGGKVSASVVPGDDVPYSVTLQADGKILVSGWASSVRYDFAVRRFNSDGSPDGDFGSGGVVTTHFDFTSYGYSMCVQPDGKIIVAGSASNGTQHDFALIRYNSDGSLDSGFGSRGILKTAIGSGNDVARSIALQADGKIVVAGEAINGSYYDSVLVRYNNDGSLDQSFGTGGKVITSIGSYDDKAYSVRIQADGKIVLVGTANDGGYYCFALARYNIDGSLDTAFDPTANKAGLGNQAGYTENASAINLNGVAKISDAELAAAGNYGGATLTLVRHGGANPEDVFAGAGVIAGESAGNVVVSTTTIGTYTWTAGTLHIKFNSAATQSLVNTALQAIRYANTSNMPPSSVQIDWLFSDGNSGSQGTGGSLTATGSTLVNITAVNDAPTLAMASAGAVAFTENADAVVLSGAVLVADTEIALVGNYGGATMTLARHGSANSEDVFAGAGVIAGESAGNVVVSDTTIGTYTWTAGTLHITFSGAATQSLVNTALQAIRYANTSNTPPSSVQIDWLFSDGNTGSQGTGGAQKAHGSTIVNITTVNDAPEWYMGEARTTPAFTENAEAVALNGAVQIADFELNVTEHFGGATLTLARHGGANPEDVFAGAGLIAGESGGNVVVSDTTIGSYALTDGTLHIAFNGAATPLLVNTMLQAILYANTSDAPPSLVEIDWIFCDGNTGAQGSGGALTATGSTAINITPVNDDPSGSVTISGSFTQGETLTVSDTLSDPDGLGTITYIWQANGATIGTGNSYTLTQAEVGAYISVTASYTDGCGGSESISTPWTNWVANVNDQVTGEITISGTVMQGETLTIINTLSDPDSFGEVVYTWQADGTAIGTGDAWTLTQAEVGKVITVTVRYIDYWGTEESAVSEATAPVVNANDLPTGSVDIEGQAQIGRVLTATNTLQDADGIAPGAIHYQWSANNVAISGATGESYVVRANDKSKTISVTASYTDTYGTTESVTSSLTAEVTPIQMTSANYTGVNYSEWIVGTEENNVINGMGGDDTLDGGSGIDTLTGGTGNDFYLVDLTSAAALQDTVTETGTLATEIDTVCLRGNLANTTATTITLGINIENLDASLTDGSLLNLAGNASSNVLTGNDAANVLTGGAGADTLNGGEGSDLYLIALATDYATGEVIADTGTGGTDEVRFALAAAATLTLGSSVSGIESIVIGTGTTAAAVTTATTAINVNASALTHGVAMTGNAGANALTGGSGNDNMAGNGGNDSLLGGNGNDTLVGGAGADRLSGGAGNDIFAFAAGDSGQSTNIDVINDYAKGAAGSGDAIKFGTNLTIGGSTAIATTNEASIGSLTGVASFAAGSGTKLADAVADVAARFTAAGNTAGAFAFFKVNGQGDYHLFISDGVAGVTVNDVVVQLVGVTSIASINTSGDMLTVVS